MNIVAVTGAQSGITYEQVAEVLDTYNKGQKILQIVAGDRLGVERHALAYAANRDLPFNEKDGYLLSKGMELFVDAIIFIAKEYKDKDLEAIAKTVTYNKIPEITIRIV